MRKRPLLWLFQKVTDTMHHKVRKLTDTMHHKVLKLLKSNGSVPKMLYKYGKSSGAMTLIADKAYESNQTRNLALSLGTEFATFSAVLLNEFIEKVIVHEAVKINGKRTMQVDIYLNYIGKFELPQSEYVDEQQTGTQAEPQKLTGTRGRKLRRDMTPEELRHEREIDARYYARKKAKRVAVEEKVREDILMWTNSVEHDTITP